MSKVMKNVVTIILAAVLCGVIGMVSASAQEIVGMKMHKTIGLDCSNCHVEDAKANKNMTPTCVSCHAPGERYYHGKKDSEGNSVLKEYPESGKTRMANFHDSHGGEIRCTVCHTSHEKEPQPLYCNNCHQFDVKIK